MVYDASNVLLDSVWHTVACSSLYDPWYFCGINCGFSFFISNLIWSNCHITRKTKALTRQTFVGKIMSLLFNMLSRLVIAFLPRSKCLLISWLQSPSAVILEPPKNKVWHCFHCFPIYFPWSDETRCHNLHFLKGYSISSKGFMPTVVDIMVIWIKFTHFNPF